MRTPAWRRAASTISAIRGPAPLREACVWRFERPLRPMRRRPVTNSIGAAGRYALLLASSTLLSVAGCTNLDENPTSSITPGNYYRNEAEVLGALAGVYASVRTTLPAYGDSYYDLSEISTDEMIVPTRGQDWYDNGRWLEIQGQHWPADGPPGL